MQYAQNLYRWLQDHNISSTPDQPAAAFFEAYKDHLDNKTSNLYIGSGVTLALSKILIDHLPTIRNSKQFVDFNPLLKHKSSCFEDFFDKFCVSNAQFSCEGRNLM